jgi:hypothetical protein
VLTGAILEVVSLEECSSLIVLQKDVARMFMLVGIKGLFPSTRRMARNLPFYQIMELLITGCSPISAKSLPNESRHMR